MAIFVINQKKFNVKVNWKGVEKSIFIWVGNCLRKRTSTHHNFVQILVIITTNWFWSIIIMIFWKEVPIIVKDRQEKEGHSMNRKKGDQEGNYGAEIENCGRHVKNCMTDSNWVRRECTHIWLDIRLKCLVVLGTKIGKYKICQILLKIIR